MLNVRQCVLPDGGLDDSKITAREPLYKGNNGKWVERFYTASAQSYIFKPLTNPEQFGAEAWVYEHLMPALPPLYPRMIAAASCAKPEHYWIVWEDLGTLVHDSSPSSIMELVKHVAGWHALPAESLLGAPLQGPKPVIAEMRASLLARYDQIVPIMRQCPRFAENSTALLARMEHFEFSDEKVVSHGDLHAGNFAMASRGLVVLDWEHVHLNTRFWDLYHALDISHPTLHRRVSPELRLAALHAYLDEAERQSFLCKDRHLFVQEYHMFACVFSLWMLLLIQSDLDRNDGKWPVEQLREQWQETLQSFNDCSREYTQ